MKQTILTTLFTGNSKICVNYSVRFNKLSNNLVNGKRKLLVKHLAFSTKITGTLVSVKCRMFSEIVTNGHKVHIMLKKVDNY